MPKVVDDASCALCESTNWVSILHLVTDFSDSLLWHNCIRLSKLDRLATGKNRKLPSLEVIPRLASTRCPSPPDPEAV